MNKEIYLDYLASAPVTDEVINHLMSVYNKKHGNSSSIHHAGVIANIELEKARIELSKKIHCQPEEIYFTSGATESNNIALNGIATQFINSSKKEIIISTIEHSSISEIAHHLINLGFKIKYAPVDTQGMIDLKSLSEQIGENTLLVSIIHANNEIGTIQELEEIGNLCKKHNSLFHSDGAQAFCKIPVDVKKMNLDLYSLSGHKIHAPKGIGALYISAQVKISATIFGGGQELGMRPGTVPIELASTMARASKYYDDKNLEILFNHYVLMSNELKKHFKNLQIHGHLKNHLNNVLNFSIPGFEGKFLLQKLDQQGIRVSVGSACNSGKKTASKVLLALSLSEKEANEAIRVSWSYTTTSEEILLFIEKLIGITDSKLK